MPDIDRINGFLQERLARGNRDSVAAVEAAEWLNRAGLLSDSSARPGLPLRNLLRDRRILGQRQESNGRWFIRRVSGSSAGRDVSHASENMSHNKLSAVDEPRPADFDDVLPDILVGGLRVVFVGTAVGDTSARKKHYYSNPSNAFYRELYGAGLTPRLLAPEEDASLPLYGIGLTDLAKGVHASDDRLVPAATLSAGGTALKSKLERFRPAWVCFNGKRSYAAFGGNSGNFGEVDEEIEGCRVYVVPEGTKGWSYRRLFGEYLRGAARIVIRDPYVRAFFQNRNLMEFLQMVFALVPENDRAVVHLVTKPDRESPAWQEENLNKMVETFAETRVAFSWEFDNSPGFHSRSITTDTGWKIITDRGLDIFQRFESGPFSLEAAEQETRLTRGVEVTYLQEEG